MKTITKFNRLHDKAVKLSKKRYPRDFAKQAEYYYELKKKYKLDQLWYSLSRGR